MSQVQMEHLVRPEQRVPQELLVQREKVELLVRMDQLEPLEPKDYLEILENLVRT